MALPSGALAQSHGDGLWVEMGFGAGWNLLRGSDPGSTPQTGGYLRAGGTLHRRVLVGGEIMGWARPDRRPSEAGKFVFSAFNLSAIALVYPIESWPWYVKGGFGAGMAKVSLGIDVGAGIGTARPRRVGLGVRAGVGVDARSFGPVLLTFNADWGGQSFGVEPGAVVGHNAFLLLTMGVRWR